MPVSPASRLEAGRRRWTQVRTAHTAAMLDQLWAMARDGTNAADAAEKVLATRGQLYLWCRDHDPDLWTALLANKPSSRRDDLAFMAATGTTVTEAASRLGIRTGSLRRWCKRHDPRLWMALRDNSGMNDDGAAGRRFTW
jgi:hypothetical protein